MLSKLLSESELLSKLLSESDLASTGSLLLRSKSRLGKLWRGANATDYTMSWGGFIPCCSESKKFLPSSPIRDVTLWSACTSKFADDGFRSVDCGGQDGEHCSGKELLCIVVKGSEICWMVRWAERMLEDTVGDKTDGTCTDCGGSSNRCCWALQAQELGRDNIMIPIWSMCGASKDGMVSTNGCADGNDDWTPAIESFWSTVTDLDSIGVGGGDGPMKCDGLISGRKNMVRTYCIALAGHCVSLSEWSTFNKEAKKYTQSRGKPLFIGIRVWRYIDLFGVGHCFAWQIWLWVLFKIYLTQLLLTSVTWHLRFSVSISFCQFPGFWNLGNLETWKLVQALSQKRLVPLPKTA